MSIAMPRMQGESISAGGKNWWRIAYAITLLALVLRLGVMVSYGDYVPLKDDAEYVVLGHQLLETGKFTTNIEQPTMFQGGRRGDASALRGPGLPVFLAVHYRLFGPSNFPPRLSLVILASLTSLLLALLGRALLWPLAGLMAAACWAVWPMAVFSDYRTDKISPETIGIFLLVAAAYLLALIKPGQNTVNSPGTRKSPLYYALAGGLLIGIAILTRGYLIFMLPLWIVALSMHPPVWRWRLSAVFAVGVCVVVIPWVVRNKIVMGKATIGTQTDAFYWGNNRWARGSFNGDMYKLGRKSPQIQLLEQRHPDFWQMSEVERSEMWTQEGLRELKDNPKRAVWLIARKLAVILSPIIYAPMPWYSMHWMWLISWPLALVGSIKLWRQKQRLAVWLVISPFLCVTIAQLMTASLDRYRFPAEPFVILLACQAVISLFFSRKQPVTPESNSVGVSASAPA